MFTKNTLADYLAKDKSRYIGLFPTQVNTIGILFSRTPDGLAHLPPIVTRRLTHISTKLRQKPLRNRAEGGQVEPVLGADCEHIRPLAQMLPSPKIIHAQ